jgi:hypothetical protein
MAGSGCQGSVFAWLTGALGALGIFKAQPGDRVCPSVWGIWIGMGDEVWHESKPQVSGSAIHRRTTSQVGNADEARQKQRDE